SFSVRSVHWLYPPSTRFRPRFSRAGVIVSRGHGRQQRAKLQFGSLAGVGAAKPVAQAWFVIGIALCRQFRRLGFRVGRDLRDRHWALLWIFSCNENARRSGRVPGLTRRAIAPQ